MVVFYNNKKPSSILISSTKFKYITLGYTIKKIVYNQKFINKIDLNVAIIKNIILYGKNEISIALTKNIES